MHGDIIDTHGRFISPEPNSGCWLWTGGGGRYGVAKHCKEQWLAHRLSYFLCKGSLDKDLKVCHVCDNTWCVNPGHLFLGTQNDNNQDCIKKGRHAKGEMIHTAKLNPDKVLKIRADNRACSKIAVDFGISESMVCLVKSKKWWAFV